MVVKRRLVPGIAAGVWLMRGDAEDEASFYDHLYDIPACLT